LSVLVVDVIQHWFHFKMSDLQRRNLANCCYCDKYRFHSIHYV